MWKSAQKRSAQSGIVSQHYDMQKRNKDASKEFIKIEYSKDTGFRLNPVGFIECKIRR